MTKELIALFGAVYVEQEDGSFDNSKEVAWLTTEAQALGYLLAKPLTTRLSREVSPQTLFSFRENLLKTLEDITGNNRARLASTLFKNFPYEVPDQHEYFMKRVISFFASDTGLKGERLSCGHIIDLFNLQNFGACPVCQFQVPELLSNNAPPLYEFDKSNHEYKMLGLVEKNNLANFAGKILQRKSSINIQERKLVEDIKKIVPLNITGTVSKENLPILFSIDRTAALAQISGATDVLRIAAYLSDPLSDLSLATNVKFVLTTSEKKSLLAALNDQGNLEEDFLRHREKWLRFGETVNPGTKKNRARYPFVAAAFDKLRNDPGSIKTFSRVIDAGIRSYNIDKKFLSVLKSRPGEFARKLNAVILRSVNVEDTIAEFVKVLPKIETKMLFELKKFFQSRSGYDFRVFFPKGPSNRAWVRDGNPPALDLLVQKNIIDVIDGELKVRFERSAAESKKYFIDPNLAYMLVPFNKRGDSETNTSISKGSSFLLQDKKVVRLFTWWKGYIDVDLSINMYDENFNNAGHVAYTNLASSGIKHSGDIQSAPNGAVEYIDVDISRVSGRARYMAVQLNVFRGENFKEFPCFVGFMERDSMTSGEQFQPETVKLKFDVNSDCRVVCPMIFDILTNRIIFTDLQLGNRSGVSSARNNNLLRITKSFLSLYDRKPTIYDIFEVVCSAQGSLVSRAEDAEIVINVENVDVDDVLGLL